MANTPKKKLDEFVCMYVCCDGLPKTIMKSLRAESISDAAKRAEVWIESMVKKEGKEYNSRTIASMTIMPKPFKGRKPKAK